MSNYTPIIEFSDIPLTGVLVPGITQGYVAESKYIKGGYIVVKTIEERDALLDTATYEDREALTVGSPVFVSDENKTYRYMGEGSGPDLWVEDTADLETVQNSINDLQQIVLDINSQLNEKATKEDITTVTDAIANVQAQVNEQSSQLSSKVDGEQFFTALTNISAELNKKADKTEIPTSLAQLSNADTGYITAEVNNLTNYTTTEHYKLDQTWDFEQELAQNTVGGLVRGTTLTGKSLKDILYMILVGGIAPTITEPTFNITQKDIIGIVNSPATINGTVTFDRGKIVVVDQQSGEETFQNYRAGEVVSYTFNNGSGIQTIETNATAYDFSINVPSLSSIRTQYAITVNYAEGPQPEYSGNIGAYGEPLPAGSMTVYAEAIGLTNTWSGTSEEDCVELDNILGGIITDDDDIDSVGMFKEYDSEGNVTGAGFQLYTPEVTESGQIPTVLIQDSVEITGIEVADIMSHSWVWYTNPETGDSSREGSVIAFEKVGTTTREINHQVITYNVYHYTGLPSGEMYFRVFVD